MQQTADNIDGIDDKVGIGTRVFEFEVEDAIRTDGAARDGEGQSLELANTGRNRAFRCPFGQNVDAASKTVVANGHQDCVAGLIRIDRYKRHISESHFNCPIGMIWQRLGFVQRAMNHF